MMRLLLAYSWSVLAMGVASSSLAATQDRSQGGLDAAIAQATSEYRHDKDRCATLSGNAREVCLAEAESRHRKARTEAAARHRNTEEARAQALEEAADADYLVAKAKCGAFRAKDKEDCLREAQAKQLKAKENARASSSVAQADRLGARRNADLETSDAQFNAALEKCEAMSGRAKDDCTAEARAKFGKN